MGEGQRLRVEQETLAATAIKAISQERQAQTERVGRVDAQLVGAASERIKRHERSRALSPQH